LWFARCEQLAHDWFISYLPSKGGKQGCKAYSGPSNPVHSYFFALS
jgi:hypothetical protein